MDFENIHSFAILAYTDSPYLEACIQSILNQNKKSSVYISTSTPTENIREIADKYNLSICVNKVCDGIAADWNFAVGLCETPFLTLAHQDDIYFADYTEKLVPAMQKAGDSIIAFCNYKEIVKEEYRVNTLMLGVKCLLLWPYLFNYRLKSRFFKRLILRFGSPVCCPSVIYNIAANKPAFGKNFRNDMDWDAWLQLSEKKGSFIYIQNKLMAHRIHEDSETTRQIANVGRYEEDLVMFKRLWPSPIAKLLAWLYKNSYKSNKI